MRAAIVVLILAAAPALAGCVDPDIDPSDVGSTDSPVLPYLDLSDAHDHADVHQHDAGWNIESLGWNAFTDDHSALGRYNQVQVFGDFAFVSVYFAPPDMRPGLVVLDVADPAKPEVVAQYDSGRLTPIDVHLSEDGRFLALGGHRTDVREAPALPLDACTSIPVMSGKSVCQPFVPGGIQLLDVSDPTSPTLLASYYSAPSGAHTVKLQTIGGELYAFIASYGFTSYDRSVSTVEIVRYAPDGPAGAMFEPVSRFFPSEPSSNSDGAERRFVHDMYVAEHPGTGDLLMYVSYWDGGVVIADVSDPANPTELAAWKDFDSATFGNIHYAVPMPNLIDGKHITVAAPEYGSAEHAGESYVIDTTDPTQPKLLGKWTVPGNPVNSGSYIHSPHNFDLTPDGLMVMGHYHAGVWVLDLNPVIAGESDEPTVLAYRFTVPPADSGYAHPEGGFAGNVWNAVWHGDDTIVVSDIENGLHVLRLTTRDAGTPPYAGIV